MGYPPNSVYFTAHLYIFMTYLEEIKVESKEYSHEADFCYGRANGGTWTDGKRNKPDGNPLRGQARSWAVGETWHVVTCEVFVMH